jgi:hypothetical protein
MDKSEMTMMEGLNRNPGNFDLLNALFAFHMKQIIHQRQSLISNN